MYSSQVNQGDTRIGNSAKLSNAVGLFNRNFSIELGEYHSEDYSSQGTLDDTEIGNSAKTVKSCWSFQSKFLNGVALKREYQCEEYSSYSISDDTEIGKSAKV